MQFTAPELGFAPPLAPPSESLPPGGGRFVTPEFLTFAALFTPGFRGHRWAHDEAMKHSAANARAMRNDCSVMEALRARQMPTAMLSWHVEPADADDPAQAEAASLVETIIREMPYFQRLRMHLLEGLWYGFAAVSLRYRWDFSKPNPFDRRGRRLLPCGHEYYNGDKLRFKWDGSVGVLVNSNYPGVKETTDFGYAHFLTPEERESFVVHRHEPDSADYWESDLSGLGQGAGIRHRVYWMWYIKQQLLAHLMTYVERFANGLTLFYYDASNAQAKTEMEAAIAAQAGQTAYLLPRWGSGKDQNAVERVEVGMTNPAFLASLIDDYYDKNIRRYILGQTLSSDTAPTGLGSGVAEAHTDTLSKIIKYDAQNLDATLTEDFVRVLYRYNAPHVPPGRFVSDVDTPNATEVLGNAQIMQQMGLAIDGDHLYEVTGLPKPGNDDTAVTSLQPQSAVGVGAEDGDAAAADAPADAAAPMPAGVPAAGPPGPQPQPTQMQMATPSRAADVRQRFKRHLKRRLSKRLAA